METSRRLIGRLQESLQRVQADRRLARRRRGYDRPLS
jgi:hypothetical protein